MDLNEGYNFARQMYEYISQEKEVIAFLGAVTIGSITISFSNIIPKLQAVTQVGIDHYSERKNPQLKLLPRPTFREKYRRALDSLM